MKLVWAVLALLLACAGCFAEEETAPSGVKLSADVGYVSKYVWRGMVVNSDPAIQPSITVTHPSGLSFNFWANYDTTDANGTKGRFTENDYTFDYAWTCRNLEANAGYAYYAYPNTSDHSTSEVYAAACFGGPLSPSLAANYDVDEAKGLYVALSGGYDCSMAIVKDAPTKLNLTAKVGYANARHNNFYLGVDKSAFVDLAVGASAPIEAGCITVTPSLTYSRLLDGALRDSVTDPDNWVFGLGVSKEF